MDWLTFTVAMTKTLAWPLTTIMLAVLAIRVFREPIAELINRISKLKFGRMSMEAKASKIDAEIVKRVKAIIAPETADGAKPAAASGPEPALSENLDADHLVIRDSNGLTRIIAGTVESGEPFLALIDEEGEIRASLSAGSAADPAGVAMLMFSRKGLPPGDMAAMIGTENSDSSGAVGVRDSSGVWKEMS